MAVVFLTHTHHIVSLVLGSTPPESVLSLRLMAVVPLVIGINVPAVMVLLGNGLDKEFSRIVMAGAFLDLALNLVLVPHLSYIGSCIAVVLAEAFVTFGLYVKVVRRFGYREILSLRGT
jgi:O-antigen/teichoic acid export membrane protein